MQPRLYTRGCRSRTRDNTEFLAPIIVLQLSLANPTQLPQSISCFLWNGEQIKYKLCTGKPYKLTGLSQQERANTSVVGQTLPLTILNPQIDSPKLWPSPCHLLNSLAVLQKMTAFLGGKQVLWCLTYCTVHVVPHLLHCPCGASPTALSMWCLTYCTVHVVPHLLHCPCGASPTALSTLSAVAADPAAAAGRLAPPTVAGTVADAIPETTSVMVCICRCISAISSCRVAISAGGVNGGASFSRPRSGRVLFALPEASSPVSGGRLRLSSLLRWHSRTLRNAHQTVLGTMSLIPGHLITPNL